MESKILNLKTKGCKFCITPSGDVLKLNSNDMKKKLASFCEEELELVGNDILWEGLVLLRAFSKESMENAIKDLIIQYSTIQEASQKLNRIENIRKFRTPKCKNAIYKQKCLRFTNRSFWIYAAAIRKFINSGYLYAADSMGLLWNLHQYLEFWKSHNPSHLEKDSCIIRNCDIVLDTIHGELLLLRVVKNPKELSNLIIENSQDQTNKNKDAA
jgi:hypothetical protein